MDSLGCPNRSLFMANCSVLSAVVMTYPERMKNDPLPNCPELLQEREDIVLRLGRASVRLCEANDEYMAVINELLQINQRIEER